MTETVQYSATFPNILAVVDYLRARGWKVGKSIVYQHRNAGKLRPRADGLFHQKDADKYARTFLRRLDTGQTVTAEMDGIQHEKLRAETDKLKAQAEHWQIKAKAISGQYVEKEYFDRELSKRAAIFRADLEGMFRSKAADLVALAGGDTGKIPEVIEFLLAEGEIMMTRYSEERPIEVPPLPETEDDEEGSEETEEDMEDIE